MLQVFKPVLIDNYYVLRNFHSMIQSFKGKPAKALWSGLNSKLLTDYH